MSPKEQKILAELNKGPIYAARAWWVQGKTDTLLRFEDLGLAVCRGRHGEPAQPTDDNAIWTITDRGRIELQMIA